MPIRKELRGFYPIDWSELSAVIRFERAKGRCEGCGRPHGKTIWHLGDGRWFDPEAATWRNDRGREIVWPDYPSYKGRLQATQVVLATAHLDHDPTNNRPRTSIMAMSASSPGSTRSRASFRSTSTNDGSFMASASSTGWCWPMRRPSTRPRARNTRRW